MPTIKGGDKLQAQLRILADKVTNAATLRAGFLERATYPNGTSVAMVAAIQDFGAPKVGIPPRPFFRNVISAGANTWGDDIDRILKANDMDANKSLSLMGELIKGQIQNSINNGSYAPLKRATVRRKGFDKPLIDTAHMLNSVDYEVTA